MARFFKGVGVGTHWHTHNPQINGISAHNPGVAAAGKPNVHAVIQHIANITQPSPYVSLTKSYAVAADYALEWSVPKATQANPAYVFQIDIPDPPPRPMLVFDPVAFLAAAHNNPVANLTYHHDGDMKFLLGLVGGKTMSRYLTRPVHQLGGSAPASLITPCLKAMVRALRDAEVLVMGGIPSSYVVAQHSVY